MIIKLTKSQWEKIGNKAGWISVIADKEDTDRFRKVKDLVPKTVRDCNSVLLKYARNNNEELVKVIDAQEAIDNLKKIQPPEGNTDIISTFQTIGNVIFKTRSKDEYQEDTSVDVFIRYNVHNDGTIKREINLKNRAI